MKVRIITPGTAACQKRAALSCVTLAILVSTLVCACTSSPGKTAPAIYTPPGTSSRSHTGTATASPSSRGKTSPASTSRASATSTQRAPASQKATTAPSHSSQTPARAATRFPTGAPQTGGGGTAGLQDGLLFGVGAAAMLAGLGSLAYRRRLTRTR
jgi:hypothetical protein